MITLRQMSQDEDVAPGDVQSVIDNTQVVEVTIDECQCGPVRGLMDPAALRIQLDNETPEFGLANEGSILLVRVTHVLRASSEEEPTEDTTTTLSVTHLVTFQATGDAEFSSAQLSAFVQTNVYFMVYPYVRQFFNLMSQEMGLPPIVLGYRRRDDWPELPPAVE